MTLFEKVETRVRRYIKRHFGRHTDHEDICQEALIEVWQQLDKFNPSHPRANLEGWACGAAKMAALKFLGKQRWVPYHAKKQLNQLAELEREMREQGITELDHIQVVSGLSREDFFRIRSYALQTSIGSLYDTIVTPDGEEAHLIEVLPCPQEDTELRMLVQAALDELSTEKQLLLVLHDLLGMDMDEVSYIDSRGRTPGALYAARIKALEELRGILTRHAEDRCRERLSPPPETPQQVLAALLG
jgi:RNA polymerase sigma factor (sigma-70 family)